MKVVFAMRKEGIRPSSTLSNTYFKAKKVRIMLESAFLECILLYHFVHVSARSLSPRFWFAVDIRCTPQKKLYVTHGVGRRFGASPKKRTLSISFLLALWLLSARVIYR